MRAIDYGINLDPIIGQTEDLEDEFYELLKNNNKTLEDMIEYIEHCAREMREMRSNLEDIQNKLNPFDPDDIDGGLASYR